MGTIITFILSYRLTVQFIILYHDFLCSIPRKKKKAEFHTWTINCVKYCTTISCRYHHWPCDHYTTSIGMMGTSPEPVVHVLPQIWTWKRKCYAGMLIELIGRSPTECFSLPRLMLCYVWCILIVFAFNQTNRKKIINNNSETGRRPYAKLAK